MDTTSHNKAATLTVGNKTYDFPISSGTIGPDVVDIGKLYAQSGMFTYDPGFTSTASCQSSITYIDGDAGILEYRGYPIEQLAEKSNYLEVSYLLINGELPTASELADFICVVTNHTYVHENIKTFMDGFRYDAHPMSILGSTVAALSGFYPDAMNVKDEHTRRIQMIRMIAKMPTIAAFSYRHRMGLPYVYPNNDLSYCGNFLSMVKRMAEANYRVN